MKRETITIKSLMEDEPTAEIPALTDGPIAVHRDYYGHGAFGRYYNVTHIATSRWICHGLNLRQARLFASVLLENRDCWDFDETALAAMKGKSRKARARRAPIFERITAARKAIGAHV